MFMGEPKKSNTLQEGEGLGIWHQPIAYGFNKLIYVGDQLTERRGIWDEGPTNSKFPAGWSRSLSKSEWSLVSFKGVEFHDG